MDLEFLDFYNKELKLLYEQAQEFAGEYPGIAERLGGIVGNRADPMVSGLLEGTAFLAARVQLKLKHEFPEFTTNLLEQLVPNFLAPTPSALFAKIRPPYADPALRMGLNIPRGSYLDAVYLERDRRVACRYKTTGDITLWPFELVAAEYSASATPLQGLGLPLGGDAASALIVSILHRTTAQPESEPPDAQARILPTCWFSGCNTDELPLYIMGALSDAIMLYEQIFARRLDVFLRSVDEFGTPTIVRAPDDCLQPIGFEEDDGLFPIDKRVFHGFNLVREYFMFPRKFLGFKLTRLKKMMARFPTRAIDIILVFNESAPRLSSAVKPSMFALYAVPAINLFEKTTDRIPVTTSQHEFHIVPDRTRALDFEAHRVIEVYAHYPGRPDKIPVKPLYSADQDGIASNRHHYTVRRVPRRRTADERRYGLKSDYVGTDLFLSFTQPPETGDDATVAELSVRALCSNRHLTEHLPVGEGGADFVLIDETSLEVLCVDGPTRPREPVVSHLLSRGDITYTGTVAWRVINMLSLNQLGLVERGAGKGAASIRELLALFCDPTDSAGERQIRGLRSVDSRPIVRRLRQRGGIGAARGLEITVVVDEKAFEGHGAFLLGAMLDRFFAEYSALNHFTQTILRSIDRGEIMRWPPRIGLRTQL